MSDMDIHYNGQHVIAYAEDDGDYHYLAEKDSAKIIFGFSKCSAPEDICWYRDLSGLPPYIDRLKALESKLPAYVTGERFVPGVDPCYIVSGIHKEHRVYDCGIDGVNRLTYHPLVDQWRPFWKGAFWTGTFHPTRESAQAEADRLNAETSS